MRGLRSRVAAGRTSDSGAHGVPSMHLSPAEEAVVRRAVAAYRESKKARKGRFRGVTADAVLDELDLPSDRWAALAGLVVELAEGTG